MSGLIYCIVSMLTCVLCNYSPLMLSVVRLCELLVLVDIGMCVINLSQINHQFFYVMVISYQCGVKRLEDQVQILYLSCIRHCLLHGRVCPR